MSEWVSWLREITFARPGYFDLAGLWFAISIAILLAITAKWWFRPSPAFDSRRKLLGQDAVWLFGAALAGLMIVALAGPRIEKFKTIRSSDNLDIIVAVDRSVSMAIKDVMPSRHKVAIGEIQAFISSPAVREGDRLTLFTFGEKSNWKMPLSTDRQEFLDRLVEIEHPKDGIYYDRAQLYTYFAGLLTHIPEALAKQDNYFRNGPFKSQTAWSPFPRVVFIFSDGDNIDESLNNSLAYLAKQDIRVYTIGVGTLRGGSIVVRVPFEHDLTKFESLVISSKLNMKGLDQIRQKTGGKSYVVSSSSSQVQSFMAAALAENRKPTLSLVSTGEEESFWWYFLALPSLIIVLLMVRKY
jgi:Ca-activated chloride channel family protein